MFKLYWIEVLLRGIPEMMLIIWGIHVIAKKSINMKNYIFSSITMVMITFLVRMLPIYFGVHTLIIIVILTICTVSINGISIAKAIYGVLLMYLILSLGEFLNVAILNLLNINISEVLNPIIKSMLGIPSLIITFLLIIIIRYFIASKEDINIFEDKNC